MKNEKFVYENFEDLFNEVVFDFEIQCTPHMHTDSNGVKYFTIYKTTFCELGTVERKGNKLGTFDPKLWNKVELLALLFKDSGHKGIDVLYGG